VSLKTDHALADLLHLQIEEGALVDKADLITVWRSNFSEFSLVLSFSD